MFAHFFSHFTDNWKISITNGFLALVAQYPCLCPKMECERLTVKFMNKLTWLNSRSLWSELLVCCKAVRDFLCFEVRLTIKSACSSNSSPNCRCFLLGLFSILTCAQVHENQSIFKTYSTLVTKCYPHFISFIKKECNTIILSGMTINGLKELFVIFQEVMTKSNGFEYWAVHQHFSGTMNWLFLLLGISAMHQ